MTNHFHLVVTPRIADAVSKTMQAVGRAYVYHFNRRHDRTGGLFEGRYRSTVIENESYWYNCMRYVELNPVRAGLVSRPEAYPWSSYSSNALGMPDRLVAQHSLYEALGDSPLVRQQSWKAICGQVFSDRELEEIRQAVHYGRTLGDADVLPDEARASS